MPSRDKVKDRVNLTAWGEREKLRRSSQVALPEGTLDAQLLSFASPFRFRLSAAGAHTNFPNSLFNSQSLLFVKGGERRTFKYIICCILVKHWLRSQSAVFHEDLSKSRVHPGLERKLCGSDKIKVMTVQHSNPRCGKACKQVSWPSSVRLQRSEGHMVHGTQSRLGEGAGATTGVKGGDSGDRSGFCHDQLMVLSSSLHCVLLSVETLMLLASWGCCDGVRKSGESNWRSAWRAVSPSYAPAVTCCILRDLKGKPGLEQEVAAECEGF